MERLPVHELVLRIEERLVDIDPHDIRLTGHVRAPLARARVAEERFRLGVPDHDVDRL